MTARGGFALVISLLLIIAMAVLTAGMLLLGAREAALAGTAARWAQVRRWAEADARAAFDAWSTARHEHLVPGQEEGPAAPRTGRTIRIVRLDRELFLIRADASIPAAGGTAIRGRTALLARTIDSLPLRQAAGFAALSATNSVVAAAGTVRGDGGCDATAVPGIAAPVVASTGVVITGDPPVLTDTAPPPLPNFLSGDAAADLATTLAGTRVRPRPVTQADGCADDPTNWGSVDPWHPCHDLRPVVLAQSDLEVTGGQARGVLVVHGDLVVRPGTSLEGFVLVTGTAHLEDGVTLRGALRAASVVLDGAALTYDACVLDEIFSATAFDRAYRPSDRWWLPAF